MKSDDYQAEVDIQKRVIERYKKFFKDEKILNSSGIHPKNHPKSNEKLRFATYPYIGKRYGEKTRILFIGLDIGKDEGAKIETPNDEERVLPFEEKQKIISDCFNYKKNRKPNPHISGCYFVTLYFLKEEDKEWNEFWNKEIENSKETCKKLHERLFKEEKTKLKNDPSDFFALTNYYKYVTKGRKKRAGGKDRIHLNEEEEIKLLVDEINLLDPEIVVFQSKTIFKNIGKNKRFKGIFKDKRKVYIMPHTSNRAKDGRKPKKLIKNMQRIETK